MTSKYFIYLLEAHIKANIYYFELMEAKMRQRRYLAWVDNEQAVQ